MRAHRKRSAAPRPHPQHQPNEVRLPLPLPPSFAPTPTHTASPPPRSPSSVIGIIAIPGMMTGAILGGSSVEQAARLQMVIMFMISSCTALASIATTVLALAVVVDAEHRVRADRIDVRPHAVWRARAWLVAGAIEGVKGAAGAVGAAVGRVVRGREGEADVEGTERARLLG